MIYISRPLNYIFTISLLIHFELLTHSANLFQSYGSDDLLEHIDRDHESPKVQLYDTIHKDKSRIKKSVQKKVLTVAQNLPPIIEDLTWTPPKFPGWTVISLACSPYGELFILQIPNDGARQSFVRPMRSVDVIQDDPIHIFNLKTKSLTSSFGGGKFKQPQSLAIDSNGNVYIVDLALKSVFRFSYGSWERPDLELVEKFCAPIDIAVTSYGDFFVSDSCSPKIKVISATGNIQSFLEDEELKSPSALVLLEEENLLCAADNEAGKIFCFTNPPKRDSQGRNLTIDMNNLGKVISMDHIGDLIFALRRGENLVDGITINILTSKLIDTWTPRESFLSPTDVAITRDRRSIFVCDSSQLLKQIFKFVQSEEVLSSNSHDSFFRKEKSTLTLQHSSYYSLAPGWPVTDNRIGQITGIDYDRDGNIVIFHRGPHVWGMGTFNISNFFQEVDNGPISTDTVIFIDPKTKNVTHQWGKDLFYLPHGLTLDTRGFVWLTDVALHQVFKYPARGAKVPLLTLGQRFVPGSTTNSFCKPTSVAINSQNGDIYVADGYCNGRVIRFSSEGEYLNQWGQMDTLSLRIFGSPEPSSFNIPHKIVLAMEHGLACVADREHKRVSCFKFPNGEYQFAIQHSDFQGPVYSISYSSRCGGILYAITGKNFVFQTPMKGFVFNLTTQELLDSFAPPNESFSNPHDIVASENCQEVYVVEIGPNSLWKFQSIIHQRSLSKAELSDASSFPNGFQALSSKAGLALGDKVPVIASQLASFSSTTKVMGFLVFPVIVIIILAILVNRNRSRWSYKRSSLRGFTNWVASFRNSRTEDSMNLRRILKGPRGSGFNQLATDESDEVEDDHSESEVEEFNINSVRKI
ncbi:peptidyl-glycine alpha-amidating monooxygenase-like isoform X2 [Brevipalpus obovatus]|uniref:peptidyl-glycine alpha-amidating monooxygenase-like isoform X2 n=1 Tax=Brevipalpus obovatus TaxID=246614 RepID=UPI003D9F5471